MVGYTRDKYALSTMCAAELLGFAMVISDASTRGVAGNEFQRLCSRMEFGRRKGRLTSRPAVIRGNIEWPKRVDSSRTNERMLYYYFSSKEGVYVAVLEATYARFAAQEGSLDLSGQQPSDAIREMARSIWACLWKNPQWLSLVNSEICTKDDIWSVRAACARRSRRSLTCCV
jgi:hypothetical protein